MTPERNFLDCSWGKIHYKDLNRNNDTTVLCLHGWLDNWSSFLALSKHLPFRLIAIDLPGHGLSTHLTEGCSYHFVDYVVRLKEIVKKLGLSNFHLLGHSMGAAIGSLFSSTFPEYVLSLTMVDGLGPLVNKADEARDILRESILKIERAQNRKRIFPDIELAIKARLSVGTLSYEAAKILVENQLTQSTEGWKWSYDYKLKQTSSLRLSPAQMDSFLANIKSPSLIIAATDGFITKSPYWEKRLLIERLSVKKLPGGHHLHMDSPQETAAIVKNFIRTNS